MKEKDKTTRQVIREADGSGRLAEMHQRIAELEAAEAEHRRTKEAHQTLVEHSLQGLVVLQGNRVVFANPAIAQMLGYTVEELESLSPEEVRRAVCPDDQALAWGRCRDRLEGKPVPQRYELRLMHRDGMVLWVETFWTCIEYDGEPAIQAVFMDISQRKRAEEALAWEAGVNAVIAELSKALISPMPTDDISTLILEHAERLTGSAFGFVGYVDPETGDFVCPTLSMEKMWDVCQVSDRGVVFKEFGGLWGWVLENRQPLLTNRPADDARSSGTPHGHIPIHRFLSAPALMGGELVGSVALANSSCDYTNQDLALVERLASLYAVAIQRQRAEEERERLLARIQGQAQQVQQIIDTVPEGVLLLDAGGSAGYRAILANPVATKDLAVLAGASEGDALTHLGGRPLTEFLTSPPKGLWHEIEIDGPPHREFSVIARPIDTGLTPGGWVLVTRDLTPERELQRRVQHQERLAAVGQLAAGIVHDFRNIMATITLYAQMLSRTEALSSRDRERLVTINQQALQAADLIQQILDFSRHATIQRQPLNLLCLLKEQVKLLAHILPESIEIELEYGPDEAGDSLLDVASFTVNAEPTRMQQVILNLALNARDAMPEGGRLHIGLERIRVEDRKRAPLAEMEIGDWVRMTVADTGAGIPSDVLPRIFNPFFTTKASGQGHGLGLFQVYGIVEQHEGHIDVTTEVGGGTTFTIYLRALLPRSADASTAETATLFRGQGETILVVEDSTAMRTALAEGLELLNYQVLEVANGQEALAALECDSAEIALVLSDAVMPGMGGVALLRSMRQRGLTMPMVMLTGHPLRKEMESLREQGLSDWLSKPPSMEQLAQALARALHP